MMKKLFVFTLALLLSIATIVPVASAENSVNPEAGLKGLTKEQIEKSVAEIEYIFTKILVFDDEVGYVVNEKELEKASYPVYQKEGMIAFANYMNQQKGIATTQKNTVQRCLEDALGITKGALNQVQKAIEKGEWLSVLGFLTLTGIAVSPPVLFGFFLLCGAPTAQVAPLEK
ncbi:hypothetical protein ASE42_13520 [Bacillus sp. Root920]|nr:hypothetical protein ER50_09545 [Bacillus safensis]KRE14046.1 hypothetical protein ASE42_13520 [Bacillus sp. Root920]